MPDQDKAIVTKAAVSEPAGTESPRQQAGNPDLKDSDKDESGVPWKNRAREYQEKTASLSRQLEETQDRLNELEDKIQLSASEKVEKQQLQTEELDIEDELRVLQSDRRYRPYVELVNRKNNELKDKVKHEIYLEQMNEYIDDLATKEGLKVDDLKKDLNQILLDGRYREYNPLKRAKSAYRDLVKLRELQAKEKELENLKNQDLASREGAGQGNPSQNKSFDDMQKEGDVLGMMKKLGI